MADHNPIYVPVLTTSAQSTRGDNQAGIPNEWSRAGKMHGLARPSAIRDLTASLGRIALGQLIHTYP
jgi:hypothetical protein